MSVKVCGPKDRHVKNYILTVSRARGWSQGLSPFYLGPCPLYDIWVARIMENGWQMTKVYRQFVDDNGDPTDDYFIWAQYGWNKRTADRYPMGKGVKPLYSYWNGQKLSYIEARKKIYCPLYAAAVENTDAYKKLVDLYNKGEELWLWDYDGYDYVSLGMSYKDVLNCETRKMGHAFVLAMMVDNQRVWEEN